MQKPWDPSSGLCVLDPAPPEPAGSCSDACKFLWPVDFQSSSICQTDYFELPFGLCLVCSQCSSPWLEPGGFMPRDSHRTVGKLLALSFWEDSAVLEQMAAWIPTVSGCLLPHPFPHSCIPAITTGRLSCRVFAPFSVCGSWPPRPWGLHLSKNLVFRLELSPVPSAPGVEQREQYPFLTGSLLCAGRRKC